MSDLPRCWIFQATPNTFDLRSALEDGAVDGWAVTAHKDNIKKGDLAILWLCGQESGCYGLAECLEDPHIGQTGKSTDYWKGSPIAGVREKNMMVKVKILHNFVGNPITKPEMAGFACFANFHGGNQGTNFRATQEQFDSMLKLRPESTPSLWLISLGRGSHLWEDMHAANEIRIGWDHLGDLSNYKDKDSINRAIKNERGGNPTNDSLACWEFANEMKIGDIIIAKKGSSRIIGKGEIVSEYHYDDSEGDYKHVRKVNWLARGNFSPKHKLPLKTLTHMSPWPELCSEYLSFFEPPNDVMKQQALNKILYGPPGTGKTYSTIKLAASIIEGREIENYEEAKSIFNEHRGDRIEFITFHQNYSYEDFIQGLRPDLEADGGLSFERRDGVFTRIANRARYSYILSNNTQGNLTPEDGWADYIDHLKSNTHLDGETKTGSLFKIIGFSPKCIYIQPSDSSKQYRVSGARLLNLHSKYPDFKKIKNIGAQIREAIGGCQTSYYWAILKDFTEFYDERVSLGPAEDAPTSTRDITEETIKKSLSRGNALPSSSIAQNYVIIIDEINRANISRVFGELITLIEEDKRTHGATPLSCTLPSGDDFIVPSNLYIIGTMNTADKSIALLDIALRRRFDFEAMYPKYDIAGCEVNFSDKLQKINEAIIKTKGHDYQIGHSYFLNDNDSLPSIMDRKVIPLLLEYFMNDTEEVVKILEAADIKVKDKNSRPLQIVE